MNLTEKISYIRGLCDGLELDESKPEVKVLNAIVDLLDDMAFEVSDMEELYDELSAQVDEIDQDLADVESDVYDDEDYDIEDYDDEDDDYFLDDDYEDEIRYGLEQKLEAMVRHEWYAKYKTAPTPEEREKARQRYLDERGIPQSYRWTTSPWEL